MSTNDIGWHQRSASEALKLLNSSRNGLATEEAGKRRAQYGPNLLDEAPPRSKLAMFAAQFADVPVLNALFETRPLNAMQLGICIAAALVIFIAVELEKWLRRRAHS